MPTTTTGVATSFIDFTRASNATVTDSDGKVKWAPHNLLTNSESFDAASWQKFRTTVTANASVAPNGTTTADTITSSSGLTEAGIYQTAAVTPSTAHTLSFFVKLGTLAAADFKMAFRDETAFVWIVEDVAPSVTLSSSNWVLVSYTVNIPSGCTAARIYPFRNTAVVSGTFHLWGASLYRSDLAMQPNTSAYPMYNPTTPKNLLGYTEDFSNAAWTKEGSGSVVNATIAPNGLQTADKITESTGLAVHRVYNSVALTPVNTSPYVYSVYAKAAERSIICIDAFTVTSAFTWFNLATGTVGTNAAGSTASIQSVGNGWYRCSVVRNSTSTSSQYLGLFIAPSDGVTTYTGDGTSGIYLWGAQLSDSASLDSYVPVYGAAVTSAAYYGPRRDFDPVTLACKGLLVEEQRANLLLQSSKFDNAAWVKTSATVAASAVPSPDGMTTAYKLIEDSGLNRGRVSQALTATVGDTLSVYAKAAEWSRVSLGISNNFGNWGVATFNLSTGLADGGASYGGYSVDTPIIIPVGNGWYRCSVRVAAGTDLPVVMTFNQSGDPVNPSPALTGDGTSGILIWGAQLEAGSFATSYIPVGSTTAGATRNADVASVSTQAFPYSSSAGTVVANFQLLGSNTTTNLNVVALDGATGNATLHRDNLTWRYRTELANLNITGVSNSAVNKVGFAYASSDYPISVNGGAIQTNSGSGLIGAATTLRIGAGANYAAAKELNGHIRQITYLPRRISNTELQTRTA